MRFLKRAGIAAAVLLALILLSAGAVHTGPVKQYALTKAAAALSTQGVLFEAAALDYNLLRLRFQIDEAVVRSKAAPDLPPLTRIKRMEAALAWSDILRGRNAVERVSVNGAHIHLVLDEKGRDNLPKPPPSSEEKQAWLVDWLKVDGGLLRFEDRQRKLNATLPAWEIAVDGDRPSREHAIRFRTLRPGDVTFEGRRWPLDELSAVVQWKAKSAEIRQMKLASGASALDVSGVVGGLDQDPIFNLKLAGRISLQPLFETAGIKPVATGDANLTAAIQGPLSKWRASGSVEANLLSIDRFQNVRLKANAVYQAGADRMPVPRFTLASPYGKASGSAELALAGTGRGSIEASLTSADLTLLCRTLELPFTTASSLEGRVQATWPGFDFEKADGGATISLARIRQPAKDIVPLNGQLEMSARGGSLTLNIKSLAAMGATAGGQIRLDTERNLSGNLITDVDSLTSFQDGVSQFLGTAAWLPNLDGVVRATANVSGSLKQPQVEARLSGGIKAGELPGIALAANAAYLNQRIDVRDASLSLQDQMLRANGAFVFEGPAPALDLSVRAENASLATLLTGLGKRDWPLDATISAKAGITGPARNPVVEAQVSARGIQAYGELFGDLEAEARMEQRLLRVPSATLNKPDSGPLAASGSYALDNKTFSVEARARDFRLHALTLPGGLTIRAGVDLEVTGSGSVDSPILTAQLETRALRVRDIEAGEIQARINVSGKQAAVEASSAQFGITAKAGIRIEDPYPATVDIKLEGTNLAKLPFKLDPTVAGLLHGTVSGEGALKEWRKGVAQARLEPLDLQYRKQRIQSKGPVVARYANESIEFEPAALVAMNSTVNFEGRIALEEAGPPGQVRLDGVLDLPSLLPLIPDKPKITAEGKLAVGGTVRGSLKKPDPDVRLSLTNGSAAVADYQPFTGIEIEAVARGEALRLERLKANWASSRLEGEGVIPLASGQPGRLRMEMSGLEISSIKGAPANVNGKISMLLDAESSKADWQTVSGMLTFPELSLTIDKLPIRQEGVAAVAIKDGIANIKQFELRGPETVFRLSGSAGLQDPMPLNVRAEGSFDAGVVASLAGKIRAQGPVHLEMTAGGTLKQPVLGGFAEVRGGQLALPEFSASADNLNLRMEADGDKIKVALLSGSLNGGELSGGGSFRIDGGQLRETEAKLRAGNVYLSYPLGVKTLSTSEVTLRTVEDHLRLGGAVLIQEGSYTDPLTLESGLLRYIRSGQTETVLAGERSPTLEKLIFDVGVHSLSPLVVDNNLAKATVDMHLRLRGSYYRPGLTGRITMEEGSELYLNEKTYFVDLGAITFTNEQKIEPSLDIAARTRAASYDITMKITGGGGEKIETTLTSSPSLPEPDIVALLLTGRTLDKIQGSEAVVAREQALSYLAANIGGQLTSSLERATGISQVRIEPNLIANESNPGARLTVGQDLTKDFRFIYSMNLANSSDQIYVTEYDVTRSFLARGIRQNDNTYRFEARHDLQFGGPAPPRRAGAGPERRVGEVAFTGTRFFSDKELADRFKIKPGKRFDFFEVRRGLDRLNSFYSGHGYLEARIHLKRQERGAVVDLAVDIQSGPKVEFVFEGWDVGKAVRKRIATIWRDGVFDTQRAEEAEREIRVALIRRNHLTPTVKHSITQPEPGSKRILFDIQPDVRFHDVKIVFQGASGVDTASLEDLLEKRKLQAELYSDPRRVTEMLNQHYREKGYLNAKIEPPRLDLDASRRAGKVIIPISEGPRFQAGNIYFAGNQAYSSAELAAAVPLAAGKPFEPAHQEQSVTSLKDLYARKGYTEAQIEPSVKVDRDRGVVNIEFRIAENRQRLVAGVQVKGNSAVSPKLVQSQLELEPGSPLDLSALSRSRRNLYSLGAFQMVEIDRDEKPPEAQPTGAVPVQLNVQLREVRPFQVKYGGYYDTERGPGGIIDLANRNSLGGARVLGLRARYDSDLRETRLYFSQPLLRRVPLRTVATTFLRRELQPAFITDRVGFTAQQEAQPWRNYIFNYGFRWERVHTFEKEPDPIIPFDVTLRVAPLTASFTRETRDDILDASRGSMISHAVEWAPGQLGSQLHFIRYFGQYFKFISLSRPSELAGSGLRKSRLVYAGAVRVGLGGGLGGQDLVPSERFFSGGGTSIRGFRQDRVGPVDFRGNPVGGGAVLILNNELRFPLASIFDGVGFVDLGNVYTNAGDLSLRDIRKAAGAGLRVRTPYFLLRFDYGIKLGRKPGESFGQFFFSIGQAF